MKLVHNSIVNYLKSEFLKSKNIMKESEEFFKFVRRFLKKNFENSKIYILTTL